MVDEDSDRSQQTGEVVAGGIALATLILADQVSILHTLFGLPIFLYLIQDFKRPFSFCNRIIVSMELSFVMLLLTCFPIDLCLDHFGMAQIWDIIIACQWIIVCIFFFVVKTVIDRKTKRGEA